MHRQRVGGVQRLVNLPNEPDDTDELPLAKLDGNQLDLCGNTCWLKRFGDLGNGQDALQSGQMTLPPRQNFAAASEHERRHIASQLYAPLLPWQTRILALQLGHDLDTIICTLESADLISHEGVGLRSSSTIIPFEALSYSWGYPEFTARITCNGLAVPATQCLLHALYALRSPHTTRYLWIDAFCINQLDLSEKARQVRDILLIYEKAAAVIAWLGMPLARSQGPALEAVAYAWEQQAKHPQSAALRHKHSCQAQVGKFGLAFDDILSRPWFTRTWVRHEVFAAREMHLQLGTTTVPWEKFVRGTFHVQTQLGDMSVPPHEAATTAYRSLTVLAEATVDSVDGWTRAFGVLTNNILFGATDARDRIYGLIGMIFDKRDASVYPIDYERGVERVYQDLLAFFISTYRNLEALHIFRDYGETTAGIPSWVIDWRACHMLCLPSQVAKPGTFSDPLMQWDMVCRAGQLNIKGWKIARIRDDLIAMDDVVSKVGMLFHPDPEAGYLHFVNPHTGNHKFNVWWRSDFQTLLPFMQQIAYEPVSFDFDLPQDYKTSELNTPGWPRLYSGLSGRRGTGTRTGEVDGEGCPIQAAVVPIEFVMLASRAVKKGDLIVKLDGLQRFACVRKVSSSSSEYFFLGPVMLIMRNPLFYGVETHLTNNLACMEVRPRHFPVEQLSEQRYILV
ncbi:hypothetical protein LTR85_000995 [Meristemomyces frigidus]|nr:hypothetical protein LTR85_000995 [Meristemomyces frigidus]